MTETQAGVTLGALPCGAEAGTSDGGASSAAAVSANRSTRRTVEDALADELGCTASGQPGAAAYSVLGASRARRKACPRASSARAPRAEPASVSSAV